VLAGMVLQAVEVPFLVKVQAAYHCHVCSSLLAGLHVVTKSAVTSPCCLHALLLLGGREGLGREVGS
jgi:hypothetical protein